MLEVFTGAGMSTESGLPDFRSADNGLWKKQDPGTIASTDALKKHVVDLLNQRFRIANWLMI